jgi:UDP-4-amino-4,6-dideoxy-N-acetyl-beta-L-altrosamine transaminase
MIPYGRQDISEEDIQAVVDVLKSDFLTQGPVVPLFEKTVADYCGATHAVATNSATSSLHIACLSLELGIGDWLWTSPLTFVASANCALYCGAKVDFVDIDPRTYNLCPSALERKLQKAEKAGCLPKIIIPVHLCGQSCDMEAISKLAKRYGFKVIEDASHAIGGGYQNKPIGSSTNSEITIFSFHPVKIITTGEGGMALTNNAKLASKMKLLRSHGVTRDPDLMTHEADGPWYYQQVELGFNYRITELQAALGNSQMARLNEYVEQRNQLAIKYDELLQHLPVITPWQDKANYSARHLYVIRLKLDQIHKTHREVFESLLEQGIGVNLHYIPVHTQPFYKQMGFKDGDFPNAESYYQEAISLPLFPKLSSEQQLKVVAALKMALN